MKKIVFHFKLPSNSQILNKKNLLFTKVKGTKKENKTT